MNRRAWIMILTMGFAFIVESAGAQNQINSGRNMADHILIRKKAGKMKVDIDDVEGSRYENDSFRLGTVLTDKLQFDNVLLKYNLYEDHVEFKDNGQVFIIDPEAKVQKVTIGNLNLVMDAYKSEGKIKPGYYNVLDTGRIKLLAKDAVILIEPQPAKAFQPFVPAKFERAPTTFYYKIDKAEPKPITSIKKLIAEFPDHQKSLTSFSNRRKISVNQEELIQLWEYYHSLLKKGI